MGKFLLILPAVVLLVCVRMFETSLFYDPLLEFFKTDFTLLSLPEFEMSKLLLSTSLRFIMNTILSLVVLWIAFRKKEVIQVALIIYGVLFVVLMLSFYALLQSETLGDHLPLFYVRRFLIQPLFLLILIPAFYVQRKK